MRKLTVHVQATPNLALFVTFNVVRAGGFILNLIMLRKFRCKVFDVLLF